MNINQSWRINAASWQTATRSAVVVPVYGFGMGDVCPRTAGLSAGMATKHRHADAAQATVKGPWPWSPPVT